VECWDEEIWELHANEQAPVPLLHNAQLQLLHNVRDVVT
jgi:hypothetical protein